MMMIIGYNKYISVVLSIINNDDDESDNNSGALTVNPVSVIHATIGPGKLPLAVPLIY